MLLISPASVALKRAFPWTTSIQKILTAAQPFRFLTDHLLFGSDYSGDHKGSKYQVYCFLIAPQSPSGWMSARKGVRKTYLSDGRRISFKRLGDPQRQKALVPFLQAADLLKGHLVGILVDKRLRSLVMREKVAKQWSKEWGLKEHWNERAFESMARKAHFFSICLSQWSMPGSDVTWITDQDEFVANDGRLDDARRFVARLSGLYLPHSLGVFAMNSTAIDEADRTFEDFVAIPDLAAGMLSELGSALETSKDSSIDAKFLLDGAISDKSNLIMDWFWFPYSSLRRTCIVIDKIGNKMRVTKLDPLQ